MTEFDAQPGRETPPQRDLSPTEREADEAQMYAGLNSVAGLVAGAQGVMDLLRHVAVFAERAIPRVDGAGVALIDPRLGIPSAQTCAATSGSSRRSTPCSTKG